ncbi:hypothetical protein GH714_001150 [Hevea brasiliensis]|uniref:Reverse transcriptase/retrotransposon-derived protein RNase H-like domain-containing protein n=1 Tax=Hevea brasiliensis TaxID=3981 RepID=A0A6A6LYB2_HEVBR|nr:hypothetical protein GH714_001150 [Hevea brasiliensis]
MWLQERELKWQPSIWKEEPLQWHQGFIEIKGNAAYEDWNSYVIAIAARFGDKAYEDPLADLRNLRQVNTLQEYLDSFDELYPKAGIREDQALSFFLSGLVDELQMPVRMFKPKTLAEAYSLTRLQEITVAAIQNKPKPFYKSSTLTNSQQPKFTTQPFTTSSLPSKVTSSTNVNSKELPGLLPIPSLPKSIHVPNRNSKITSKEWEDRRAKVGGEKESNELKETTVFKWGMQGYDFVAEVYVLALDSYDLILGAQWLFTLGDISWNFSKLRMAFQMNGELCELVGEQWPIGPNQLNSLELTRHYSTILKNADWVHKSNMFCFDIQEQVQCMSATVGKSWPSLDDLLLRFEDIFQEPKSLPPKRDHDHRIILKEGSSPVNIRPYKYAASQKDAIETMVAEMLQAGNFVWDIEAQAAFDQLKHAMTSAPILALLDFSKEFTLETDASSTGIGAVLMQSGHPITFISKELSPKHQLLSAYERELFAILFAVKKWHHYLQAKHFTILTDHQILKYLLEQKLSAPTQQAWMAKLMQFHYDIKYKKGSENAAADALSRSPALSLHALSTILLPSQLYNRIAATWQMDTQLIQLIQEKINEPLLHASFQWSNNQLRCKGKLVVGRDDTLCADLLKFFHDSATGGHFGISGTSKRMTSLVYWPVSEDATRLKLFPFSLKDMALDWLDSLPHNSITNWEQLTDAFLVQYFPPGKTQELRNQMIAFRPREDETLYESRMRWKELERQCPHHAILKWMITKIFTQMSLLLSEESLMLKLEGNSSLSMKMKLMSC